MHKGRNTIFFIYPSKMPKGKKSVYYELVALIRPLKEERNRIRVTIGRDRPEYKGIKSTVPITLTTIKIYLNSVVSANKDRYMIAGIEDFYYGMPMENYKYRYILLELIPKEIIQ